MTDVTLDRFMHGEDMPRVDVSGMQSLAYDVRHGDMVVASVGNMREARAVARFYRNFFGGTYVIEETRTTHDGVELFAGNASGTSHVVSDVPMFDIVHDAKTVAHDMTMDAAHAFIRAYVTDDMRRGGAKNPEKAADIVLATLTQNDMSDIYGISTVRINPAQNDAPAPEPGITNWRPTKTVGREKVRKVRELEYVNVPVEHRVWSIVEVDTLRIAYAGTKDSAMTYLRARLGAGDKLRDLRAIRTSKYEAYRADVLANGYKVVSHGQTICMGTLQEVKDYILDAVRNGKISSKTAKAVRI